MWLSPDFRRQDHLIYELLLSRFVSAEQVDAGTASRALPGHPPNMIYLAGLTAFKDDRRTLHQGDKIRQIEPAARRGGAE
jgi:hypothetical protein